MHQGCCCIQLQSNGVCLIHLLTGDMQKTPCANSYQDAQAKHSSCAVMGIPKASTRIIPLSEHQFGKDRNKTGCIPLHLNSLDSPATLTHKTLNRRYSIAHSAVQRTRSE